MKPKLSVIVTTRNSAAHIETCLQSIHNQSQKPYEVIVVDNDSKDETKQIAKKYTKSVYNHGPERSAQRNFGAQKATGTHLLFLDCDMELTPDVIKEILIHCGKGAQALYIPEIVAGENWWSRMRTFERSFYNQTVIDAIRVVSKKLFERLGGFDENLTGPEDWDLDRRVRGQTTPEIISAHLIHHEENISLKSYLAKKMYYAQDFETYKDKWGRDDEVIKKQFGILYRFIGVFTEDEKWQRLLKHPFMTISMFAVRIALGMMYVLKNNDKRG